ncbi:hypothetical protein ACFX5Q_28545 [Mesorhizobium sp. IMUNJ 23033]|uniref:hypothetical protein n=1 Tax=Mesorhizobium sp. IMUNJ 23033 TaxID=3378039 RepID=UPI00384C095F
MSVAISGALAAAYRNVSCRRYVPIDQEMVYATCRENDWLLLGVKVSLNEYELDLLRQRSMSTRYEKARRGHVASLVPTKHRSATMRALNVVGVTPAFVMCSYRRVGYRGWRCPEIALEIWRILDGSDMSRLGFVAHPADAHVVDQLAQRGSSPPTWNPFG